MGEQRIKLVIFILSLIGLTSLDNITYASCSALKSGQLVFDVSKCTKVNPKTHIDFNTPSTTWIKDLDKKGIKNLLNQYRGLLIQGQVVKSQVKDKGLGATKNALEGEHIYLYIPTGKKKCTQVTGQRLAGFLKETCCEGGGDAPCLLKKSFQFLNIKKIGKAKSSAGDKKRNSLQKKKDYKKADKLFLEKKWKKAVSAYRYVANSYTLDIRALFRISVAYRHLDSCKKAVIQLEKIRSLVNKKKIWGDEIKYARRGVFLLARCYSKLNKPDKAVVLLSAYLLQPQKYRSELKRSISHQDFGWIHTSTAYKNYKKEALVELNKK